LSIKIEMEDTRVLDIYFDGYFKDLYEFYKIVSGVAIGSDGVMEFKEILFIYEDFLDIELAEITVSDCQIEIFVDNNLVDIENKLHFFGSEIISNNQKNRGNFLTTKDPAGLMVKISKKRKGDIVKLKIPYKGKINIIDDFYHSLGLNCKNGVIAIQNLRIDYYSEKEDIQILTDGFNLSLLPVLDKNINPHVIKEIIKQNGGTVVDDVDNFLARLVVAHDPAKLTLTIYFDVSEDQKLFNTSEETPKCCQSIFAKLLRLIGVKYKNGSGLKN